MLDRKCTFGDCERSLRAKGLCGLHYSRKQRGLPLDYVGGNRQPGFVKPCSVEDCPNQFYSKGYCRFHFTRHELGTDITRPFGERNGAASKSVCPVEGCEQNIKAQGYCMTHYNQWRKGLTPKMTYTQKKRVEDENGRVCSYCLTHKPFTEYYNSKKNYCKKCMTAKAAIRQHESDTKRHPHRPDWAYLYVEVQDAKNGGS